MIIEQRYNRIFPIISMLARGGKFFSRFSLRRGRFDGWCGGFQSSKRFQSGKCWRFAASQPDRLPVWCEPPCCLTCGGDNPRCRMSSTSPQFTCCLMAAFAYIPVMPDYTPPPDFQVAHMHLKHNPIYWRWNRKKSVVSRSSFRYKWWFKTLFTAYIFLFIK